jgi:hypothetical protein
VDSLWLYPTDEGANPRDREYRRWSPRAGQGDVTVGPALVTPPRSLLSPLLSARQGQSCGLGGGLTDDPGPCDCGRGAHSAFALLPPPAAAALPHAVSDSTRNLSRNRGAAGTFIFYNWRDWLLQMTQESSQFETKFLSRVLQPKG